MPSESVPFVVPDLSSFARALGAALKARHALTPEPPGHVETLNLVARALGHRNVQSLRAGLRVSAAAPVEPHLPDIVRRIETFPVPVVAAINGAALGSIERGGKALPHRVGRHIHRRIVDGDARDAVGDGEMNRSAHVGLT